jgi:AraC-like DNA-binding protein
MTKKPTFLTTRDQRLHEAKQELENEEQSMVPSKTVQTTIILDASLFFTIKEIALKRKQAGVKPDTVTGIIKNALEEIVKQERPHK